MNTRGIKEESNLDKISNLPWPILDDILSRLPIKDAVKTSILSRQWRNKWFNLSKLRFDLNSFRRSKNSYVIFAYVVYHVLLSHRGPIHTFKFSTSHNPNKNDFNYWIRFLLLNGIKELTLDFGNTPYGRSTHEYILPPCLFSCQQLTFLHVNYANLSLPTTFQGFRNLVSLHLPNYLNTTDQVLEDLIRKCPVLERLELRNFENSDFLLIEAPMLKYLYLDGSLQIISLQNCPLLEDITFMNASHNFTRVTYQNQNTIHLPNLVCYLARLSSLKSLKFSGSFLKCLRERNVSKTPFTASSNLKVLEINEMNLDDLGEIMIVHEILELFSNLQKLHISVKRRVSFEKTVEFLDAQSGSSCCFDFLKIVEIHIIRSTTFVLWDHELKLIKFLLARSPVLEKMTIVNHDLRGEAHTEFMKELLFCKRASADVQIAYCHPPNASMKGVIG